jgi:hypothetical protein
MAKSLFCLCKGKLARQKRKRQTTQFLESANKASEIRVGH